MTYNYNKVKDVVAAASPIAKTDVMLHSIELANSIGGAPVGVSTAEYLLAKETMALGAARAVVYGEEILRNSSIGAFLTTMGLIAE